MPASNSESLACKSFSHSGGYHPSGNNLKTPGAVKYLSVLPNTKARRRQASWVGCDINVPTAQKSHTFSQASEISGKRQVGPMKHWQAHQKDEAHNTSIMNLGLSLPHLGQKGPPECWRRGLVSFLPVANDTGIQASPFDFSTSLFASLLAHAAEAS